MKKNKSVEYAVMILALFIIIVVVLLLMNGRETKTSGGGENESITALYCTAGNLEEAFFTSTTANTIENEVKVTFKDNKMDKLFYAYKGVYRSDEVAHRDEVDFHAKYDIYMGEYKLPLNTFSPSYSEANSKFNLSLYTDDYSVINSVTAVFFFIDDDKKEVFKDYSINETKNYYEKKNFQCQISE